MSGGAILGSLAGGGISAYAQYLGSRKQNQWNLERRNDAWRREERLAGSVHQREVSDLRKAGLNPILSAGGSGAPSPSGGMISAADPTAGVASGVSSAIEGARVKGQVGLLDKQNKILSADVSSAKAMKDFIDADPKAWAAGKASRQLGVFGRFMRGIQKRLSSSQGTYHSKFQKNQKREN